MADEKREKERRQLNIFVHNLKESAATNGAVRMILRSIHLYLGISVSITKAFCLGKKLDMPRLLKLSQEKALVFKSKSKLRSKDNPEHVHKLFITSDLKPFEQKQNKALRHQLADMNKVKNVYKMKNGSIVQRT